MLEVEEMEVPAFLQGRDIVCVSASEWYQNWLSNHQYMSRLSEKNRVLYVEKPRNLSLALRQGRNKANKVGSRGIGGRVRNESDSLLIATPPPVLPMRFETPLIHANQLMLRRWIRGLLNEYGFQDIILWSFSPDACFLHGHLGESLGIYSITDDHASYRGSRNRESAIRKWESRLISKADVVFATSMNLVEMKRVFNPQTFYAPHGVDAELFAQTLSSDTVIADRLEPIKKPVVGFTGLLNCRIDINFIVECARLKTEWDFVLIGPQAADFDATSLNGLPNVWIFDRCEKQELPRYLKRFDVGFIPYVVDTHTRYLHPLKALEYLAAGLPVVSTDLPAIRDYREHVAVVAGADEAVATIGDAMVSDSSQRKMQRSNFAKQCTWDRRLAVMGQKISEVALQRSELDGS